MAVRAVVMGLVLAGVVVEERGDHRWRHRSEDSHLCVSGHDHEARPDRFGCFIADVSFKSFRPVTFRHVVAVTHSHLFR